MYLTGKDHQHPIALCLISMICAVNIVIHYQPETLPLYFYIAPVIGSVIMVLLSFADKANKVVCSSSFTFDVVLLVTSLLYLYHVSLWGGLLLIVACWISHKINLCAGKDKPEVDPSDAILRA